VAAVRKGNTRNSNLIFLIFAISLFFRNWHWQQVLKSYKLGMNEGICKDYLIA